VKASLHWWKPPFTRDGSPLPPLEWGPIPTASFAEAWVSIHSLHTSHEGLEVGLPPLQRLWGRRPTPCLLRRHGDGDPRGMGCLPPGDVSLARVCHAPPPPFGVGGFHLSPQLKEWQPPLVEVSLHQIFVLFCFISFMF
jgi:hypothetical protein